MTDDSLYLRHTHKAAQWGIEATLRHLLALYRPLVFDRTHLLALDLLLSTTEIVWANDARDYADLQPERETTRQGRVVIELAMHLRDLIRARICAQSLNHSSMDVRIDAQEAYHTATDAALDYIGRALGLRP